MESQAFPRFFQPIELSSKGFLQHIEPIRQASQIIHFLRRRLKDNQLPCHQSIAGQQVSINDIVLAQYADAFSKLPDPARVNQVDRRASAVQELNQLLMINVGGFNNEGE